MAEIQANDIILFLNKCHCDVHILKQFPSIVVVHTCEYFAQRCIHNLFQM